VFKMRLVQNLNIPSLLNSEDNNFEKRTCGILWNDYWHWWVVFLGRAYNIISGKRECKSIVWFVNQECQVRSIPDNKFTFQWNGKKVFSDTNVNVTQSGQNRRMAITTTLYEQRHYFCEDARSLFNGENGVPVLETWTAN
jgi:hypothetical protein